MTTRFTAPFVQAINSVGTPLPGAKLYFYAAGTSTPQNTYTDAALTVPNANPVVADSGGKFSDIFLGTSNYKVVLTDSAGTTQYTADPVVGDTSGTATAGGASQNLLVNGGFSVNQRGVTTAADLDYCLDRWYALSQTTSITVGQQTLQENAQPTNIRLTQPSATPQRLGLAQAVEANRSQFLRGSAVALSGRVRCSVSQTVRYAILAWAGTADTVTRDVVLDWTSSSYVTGGFFAAASLVVVATGSLLPAANVWTTLPTITGTTSTSLNNLIAFVWTEATAAQNVTLDLGVMQLEAGATATSFDRRAHAFELELCQRYFTKTFAQTTAPASSAGQAGAIEAAIPASVTGYWGGRWTFPTTMRVAPTTVTTYNPSAAGALWTNAAASSTSTVSVLRTTDAGLMIYTNAAVSFSLGAADIYMIHATASAEL